MFLIQTDLPGWQMASAMSHAIHKIVSKNAANLISYRGVRRITAKVKTVICEQAPNHGSYFAYARLIARVTLNLHVFDLPVDGVYAMFFQEIIRLAERSAAKESTVRR